MNERVPPLPLQFNQGYTAFKNGWIANQYRPDSVKGKEWQRGFDTAYFHNLQRLTKKK